MASLQPFHRPWRAKDLHACRHGNMPTSVLVLAARFAFFKLGLHTVASLVSLFTPTPFTQQVATSCSQTCWPTSEAGSFYQPPGRPRKLREVARPSDGVCQACEGHAQ